jgi:hypothetical protein
MITIELIALTLAAVTFIAAGGLAILLVTEWSDNDD